jgi:hypothetical protein
MDFSESEELFREFIIKLQPKNSTIKSHFKEALENITRNKKKFNFSKINSSFRKKTVQVKKACIEDPKYVETRKTIQAFERKFNLYLLFSILYGTIFVNYIDNIISATYQGYHLWLIIMYFLPFAALSIFFSRNWQLTIGLGLVASLMNDLFYGPIRNLMGFPLDLKWYYSHWLIPSNTYLFQLNLGFTVIPVLSWMMALSIYGRIIAAYFLLVSWKAQAKTRCLT